MLKFLKRLLGLETPSVRGYCEPGVEACTLAPTPSANERAFKTYFTTLGQLQEAVTKREYERAAGLARENMRQVSGFVQSTEREYGSFDISSIPALEQGGTMLALLGDTEGLKEMREIVGSLPALGSWRSVVDQHEKDRSWFAAILAAIEANPGCLQSDIKDLIGAEDGRRIANLLAWLEKAGKISRAKQGRTYALTLAHSVRVTASPLKREVRSHRSDQRPSQLREIDLQHLPYVPLPRAPLRWEEVQGGRKTEMVEDAHDFFEIRDSEEWELLSVEKIPTDKRPDPAFREIHSIDSGLIMVDDLGKSEKFTHAPAAALRFGRAGELMVEAPLIHDVYRLGVNAFGHGLIAMSKDCIVHAYDDEFNVILETPLRESPEVRTLQHRLGIETDRLKNYLRCTALAHDNSRYLFTGVDQAWCVSMQGHALWGIKLPLKEGWARVAEKTASFGTSAEVMQALEVMNLTLPITPDDVKRRYRELAKLWHPDLNPGNASAEERMKALTGAAEILTGIDPAALPRYTGTTFAKEMNRQEFEVGATKFTVAMAMQVSEVNAADWIYAANFAGRSQGAFLAGYSGRIVQVDGEGEPVRAYDIGAVPRKIIDTGDYLYFLTDTRLYVLHSDALHALVDTVDGGNIIVAQTGFGLIEKKRFRWFREDGTYLGSIVTQSPIPECTMLRKGWLSRPDNTKRPLLV